MLSRRYILPLVLACAAVMSASLSADPAEKREAESAVTDITRLSITPNIEVNTDFIMPTLSELLGEPVDTLGFFDEMAATKANIVEYAKNFLGIRYRRGASGPKAFDCSGFTSFVFKNFGYSLNRASRAQGTQGIAVDIKDAQVGDLIFFSGRRVSSRIGHVGIVIDVNKENGTIKFIHASVGRGIRIENFPDGGYYKRRFISIRRVLGAPEFDLAQK